MNLDFTFLTEEQIFGDNKLKIFDYYGTKATITDFAITIGGLANGILSYDRHLFEDRSGYYWTCSSYDCRNMLLVDGDGNLGFSDISDGYHRNFGARPTLPYSLIRNFSSNIVHIKDGILEVEYGQYPQKAASKELQDELERTYNCNQPSISKTGKTYITDSRKFNEDKRNFKAQTIAEFEYKGKKYVRVKIKTCFLSDTSIILSNGYTYKDGDYTWIEVSPIKWLVDEENDIAVSEKILFAGVQFNHERNYKGDFANTTIKNFMDEYFSKEIIVNSNEISNNPICKNEEFTTNTQTEIIKENMSIDDIINETLFKMNEILGEEKQKVFTKVKK